MASLHSHLHTSLKEVTPESLLSWSSPIASKHSALLLSSEITLFPREIYVKCQAFARQRTGHPDRCHMT